MINILLIEDNPGDVRLISEALKEEKISNQLFVTQDGIEGLNFLYKKGKYSDAPRPHIVLLDLNLPKKDGREVLEEMKSDANLRRIPVVVLTTSSAENDIFKTYDSHANCYITKPVDLDDFFEVVRSIQTYWLDVVKLPMNGH